MSHPEDVETKAVPHDELCDKALEHYEKISTEATHYNSLVPAAIKFYKERWMPRGERKILNAASLTKKLIDDLTADLKDGWFFDPWLNPRGRPIIVASESNFSGFYWVLVKGSPEKIAGIKPFVELPSEEIPEPEKPLGYVAVRTEYIPYDKEGQPSREPGEGFVIMHKDHIYAKGTVYTKLPEDG